jgi:hypothetical protein
MNSDRNEESQERQQNRSWSTRAIKKTAAALCSTLYI